MLERAANSIKGVVIPVSRWASYLGAVVLIIMVCITVAEVVARRAFNSPIGGALEITSLGLVLFVFLTLAYCAARGGHVVLDILVVKFPKRLQSTVNLVILLLTTGILGVASWQLWVQAARVQHAGQTAGVLEVPIYPFVYVAAIGGILLTLVYFIYLLYAIEEVRK